MNERETADFHKNCHRIRHNAGNSANILLCCNKRKTVDLQPFYLHMITSTTIIVLASLLAVVAMAQVIVLLARTTRKVIDKNTEMAAELLEKQRISFGSTIDQIKKTLSSTEPPMKMEDDQLIAWLDAKMEETALFQQPNLDLKMVAERFGISQRRLLRLMKNLPQYNSFSAYLTEKRLEKACALIKSHPEFTIESICKDAGFSSRRTFQAIFKARLGVSPSEFRSIVLNQDTLNASDQVT